MCVSVHVLVCEGGTVDHSASLAQSDTPPAHRVEAASEEGSGDEDLQQRLAAAPFPWRLRACVSVSGVLCMSVGTLVEAPRLVVARTCTSPLARVPWHRMAGGGRSGDSPRGIARGDRRRRSRGAPAHLCIDIGGGRVRLFGGGAAALLAAKAATAGPAAAGELSGLPRADAAAGAWSDAPFATGAGSAKAAGPPRRRSLVGTGLLHPPPRPSPRLARRRGGAAQPDVAMEVGAESSFGGVYMLAHLGRRLPAVASAPRCPSPWLVAAPADAGGSELGDSGRRDLASGC